MAGMIERFVEARLVEEIVSVERARAWRVVAERVVEAEIVLIERAPVWRIATERVAEWMTATERVVEGRVVAGKIADGKTWRTTSYVTGRPLSTSDCS